MSDVAPNLAERLLDPYRDVEVEPGLLAYLRRALDRPHLDFAEAPLPIPGGVDTLIFGFSLRGAPAEEELALLRARRSARALC